MRKGLMALVGFAAIRVASASAADIAAKAPAPVPYVPPPIWTGFYVGGQLGWGWATSQLTNVTATSSFPAGFVEPSVSSNGPLAGFYAGYNYQLNNQFLVGVDGDISWTDITGQLKESAALIDPHSGSADTLIHHDQIDWITTVTGRLGYVTGDWLWFAKGGWAWARFAGNTQNYLTTGAAAGSLVGLGSAAQTRDGWTVGGGVEWAFATHWSAKLEYDYIDFQTANYTSTDVNLGTGVFTYPAKSATSSVSIFKGGVAFRF